MPITPNQPAAIVKYYAVGTTQVLWCASISNPAAPTFAELDGGTELTSVMSEPPAGFSVSTNFIDTPNLLERFTSQIPGRITTEASSITVYADKLSVDLRTLMARDTSGFIVVADGGLASAKGHVFAVTVGTVAPLRSADGAGMLRFDFAITAEPDENVTLPQS